MLQKDAKSRATLDKVMRHAWVTREGSEPLPKTNYVRVEILVGNKAKSRHKASRRSLLLKVSPIYQSYSTSFNYSAIMSQTITLVDCSLMNPTPLEGLTLVLVGP